MIPSSGARRRQASSDSASSEPLDPPRPLHISELDTDFDLTAHPVDSSNQPLHRAAANDAATQLRHAGLGYSIRGGNDVLAASAAEGACDFLGELLPQRVDRICWVNGHAGS
jgi:hypothetical protein